MKTALITILTIITIVQGTVLATTHHLNALNDVYIIDAINNKQQDGFCLDKWEIDFVKADKWLTDNERQAIFEQDYTSCKKFIPNIESYKSL